eukprot:jgi/Botrbrau1/10590/Bobra.0358s0010.1
MNASAVKHFLIAGCFPRNKQQTPVTHGLCVASSSLSGPPVASSCAFIAGRTLRVDRYRRQDALRFRCRGIPTIRSEITYIMVKPDGVQRGLVGEIIGRFERKGFKLKGLKLFQTPRSLAEEHYIEHAAKPFYKSLVDYIVSGPVVAMVWEGDGVVKCARKMIGATNPLESEPGTIRGDLAVWTSRNVVHGSDSIESGQRETALWFSSGEGLAEWEPAIAPWLLPSK